MGTGTHDTKPKWYRYQTRVVPISMIQEQNGIGTNQNGIGTTHQKGVGTGTELSGTGTNASNSLDICVLALLSLNSYPDGIGTLIND